MKLVSRGVLVCLMGAITRPLLAQVGELRLNGGMAVGIESHGLPASVLGNASFSLVKSRLTLGPEVLLVQGDERIFGLGAVARVNLGGHRLRPFLVGSLGGNFWKREDFGTTGLFSGSLGAGVGLGPWLVSELRVYQNLQRLGGPDNWAFMTLTGGVRIGWQ